MSKDVIWRKHCAAKLCKYNAGGMCTNLMILSPCSNIKEGSNDIRVNVEKHSSTEIQH